MFYGWSFVAKLFLKIELWKKYWKKEMLIANLIEFFQLFWFTFI